MEPLKEVSAEFTLARTWLPTALFLLFMTAMASKFEVQWGLVIAISSASLTPPLWWNLAARRSVVGIGRGALVGALSGVLIHLAPFVVIVASERNRGDGGLGNLVWLVFIPLMFGYAIVTALVGAVIGGVVARIGPRWPTAVWSSPTARVG